MIEVILPLGLQICAAVGAERCDILEILMIDAQAKHSFASVIICADGVPCSAMNQCSAIARVQLSAQEARGTQVSKPGWSTWFICRSTAEPTS